MLTGFEKKVAGFIKANGLFDSSNNVLLAVSGGADSTALLYAMCALKAGGVLDADFACAHINHQLRGAESEGDERFIIAQADNLNIAVTTKRLNVRGFARENKLSIETAARKLRIDALLDIAKTENCTRIATAHQKNDNAETIIHRLIRGTGFRGLGGIWPVRSFGDGISFVRPLLCVTRDEIIEYLKERNLNWRVDRTNKNCTYRRNYIRHRLMPELQKECNGSVVEQLFELSQPARGFHRLVCGCAEKIWPELADCAGGKVMLGLKMFSTQPPVVKVELVRQSLTSLGSGEKDLTHQHYERILQLAEQNVSGKRIELPNGFTACYEYGKLIFARKKEQKQTKEKAGENKELKIPGRSQFGNYIIKAHIFEAEGNDNFNRFLGYARNDMAEKDKFAEWFDFDKVKLPVVVRFRQAGDRFWPLGLAGEKRIGKFLTAAKVPRELRKEVLIVADSEKIIWLWPIRMSEQAKVTDETKKILQLRITDSG